MRKDIAFIAALLFLFNTAFATVWYVHPDSSLNSIQAGLDSCADSDTVLVGPGTYCENIVWPSTQGIDLVSEYGSDSSTIDGDGAGSAIVCTTGVDTTTLISGFTIQNGTADWREGGIYCCNSSPKISHNIITGNNWCGIGLENSAPIIIDNTITENTGDAIYCLGGQTIIEDNVLTGNGGYGICLEYAWGEITNNTITENAYYAIYADCGGGSIAGNVITNNGGGIRLYFSSANSIIIDNTIVGNGGGIGLSCASATIANNTITGNMGVGIGCWGEATITNNTISGNSGGGLSFGCGGGGTWATVTNNRIVGNTGRGIVAHGCYECGVSVHVSDNTISDNTGGGIYCDCNGLRMSLGKNVITGNTAEYGGGIGVRFESYYSYEPHFSGVNISENIIDSNASNDGGGIWFSIGTSWYEEFRATVANNSISGNIATRGGGISINGRDTTEYYELTVTNNTITGNSAQYGAGILCSDSTDATISYCTISANNGDGFYSDSGASPVVNYNNIMDNTGYGVRNVDLSVMVDATYNWWGDPSGPGSMGPGTGEEVSEWVDYVNWFTRPVIQHDTADFEPNTFNKKRHGKWVTVFIELRDPYYPDDIDLSTVRLRGNLPGEAPAELKPTSIGDYDNDGIPDRMVKFKSDLVNEILGVGNSVGVRITGMVNDSSFQVMDYIIVIEPGGPQSADSEGVKVSKLEGVYPNPFTRNAAIRFSVSRSTKVTLQVFDISGRLVRTLVDREVSVGSNTLAWDGADDLNRILPSGVYFLRYETDDYKETKKLILLR